MEDVFESDIGKLVFNDYIFVFNVWFILFFGKIDVDKIDLVVLMKFD